MIQLHGQTKMKTCCQRGSNESQSYTVDSLKYFVLLSLFIFSAGLKCHYCGIEDLCSLPYDTLEANYITCPNSCMKFDGEADGKKVIIRGCGSQEVDVCGEEPEQYANTRAMGTLCTCMGDKCNTGTRGAGASVSLMLGILGLLKMWI